MPLVASFLVLAAVSGAAAAPAAFGHNATVYRRQAAASQCAPGFAACGRDCIDVAKAEYHCVVTPGGVPILVQGPGFRPDSPKAPVLDSSVKLIPLGTGEATKNFEMVNSCPFEVWPAYMGKAGWKAPMKGGFGLAPGQSVVSLIFTG
jgi:hypothetical protein